MKKTTLPETSALSTKRNDAPILTFGKFKGVAIDKVPTAYLRWVLTQDFPEEIMKWAKRKVGKEISNKLTVETTRHSIDKFSLNFLTLWDKKEGLASFIARLATVAWETGEDVSKNRHQEDQTIKRYKDIDWVFNKGGIIRTLITVQRK